MNSSRFIARGSGWILVVLGSVGGLLCVALLILTWMLSVKANRSVKELFSSAAEITERIEEGTGRASGRLAELRTGVDEGRERWRATVSTAGERISESLSFEPEQVEELRRRLEPIQEWLALADSLGELVEVVEESLQVLGELFGAEDPAVERVFAAVREGRAQVKEATRAVTEVEMALGAIRESPGAREISGKVDSAFLRVDETLGGIQENLDSFERAIGGLDESLDELSSRIRSRVRLVATLATVVLIWQFAAQFCLFRAGWRRLLLIKSSARPRERV